MGMLRLIKRQLGYRTEGLDDKVLDAIGMAAADLAFPGIAVPGKTVKAESDGRCAVSVNAQTFLAVRPAFARTVLTYLRGTWQEDGESVSLATLGITVTGTPATGERITLVVDMPETDGNINMAVSCYCLWALGAEENRERMWDCYKAKKGELRMKSGYTDWGEDA